MSGLERNVDPHCRVCRHRICGRGSQVKALTGSSSLRWACSIPAVGSLISPARGLPFWDDCDASVDEGVVAEPDWDLAAKPAPDFEAEQRINW